MERSVAITAAVILAVLALPAAGQAGDHSPQADPSRTTVEVGDSGDRLWPFTSRSGFEGRTLVINVIVTEDPVTTQNLLAENVPGEWTRTDLAPKPFGARLHYSESDPSLRWRHAHGAGRYTYVGTGDGEGRWHSSQYQLHVGTYLGSRHHVRAFAPDKKSSWTALQAHSEYWDWFRLRHTVTDVHGTADVLESAFRDSDARTV